ncbi:MAG: class I SAM-dependent RNA methyltransferase [Pseudomonadota bacterium]
MVELKIHSLARQGDGVATKDSETLYIPFSLPGETVTATSSGIRRDLISVIRQSSFRIDPICTHFGECGGCQLQHFSQEGYLAWKHALVYEALERVGISHAVDPLVCFDVASRRRCVFNVKHTAKGVVLGFAERSTDRIINITECPILVKDISDRLQDIKNVLSSLPYTKKSFRLSVLASEAGLDLALSSPQPLKQNTKEILARKALSFGFARLSSDGEVLVELKKPILRMGLCNLIPPPGAFVQAVRAAEATMSELVCTYLSDCKSVADLYSGIGTFALRLAENSMVWALEENAPSLQALDRAWRETGGKLKQIRIETRNLERRPVNFTELKKIDGLVFDPPRAGAEAQVRQIAKSKIGKVAAVSCNPITLARDLKLLLEGGYKIQQITPIDQFRFTPHVEVVALLEK